jgi:hypothetical protein
VDSSSLVVTLARGRFKVKSEATRSEFHPLFVDVFIDLLLFLSFPDKTRGPINHSFYFMLFLFTRYEQGF